MKMIVNSQLDIYEIEARRIWTRGQFLFNLKRLMHEDFYEKLFVYSLFFVFFPI
jgi:hypothetical protein